MNLAGLLAPVARDMYDAVSLKINDLKKLARRGCTSYLSKGTNNFCVVSKDLMNFQFWTPLSRSSQGKFPLARGEALGRAVLRDRTGCWCWAVPVRKTRQRDQREFSVRAERS